MKVHKIKNETKGHTEMAIWSLNNSQENNYFELWIWLEKAV
jgi:hypothetical protein